MLPRDPHQLQRFLDAQDPVFDGVVAELRAGQKRTHWMWFIFPQLRGLGQSPTAKHFGIASLEEAVAYLEHPALGARLRECTRVVNSREDRTVGQIFGYPDDLKFHSSMTLFAQAAPGQSVFREALARYFGGETDGATLKLLGAGDSNGQIRKTARADAP